jgi:hypothetical protein
MDDRQQMLEAAGINDFSDPQFMYADYAASPRFIEPRWEKLKLAANSELSSGNYRSAIALYTDALLLVTTTQPQFNLLAKMSFCNGKKFDAGVLNTIIAFLPSPEPPFRLQHSGRQRIIQPLNEPAAICLSNRAAAHLKASDATKALADGIAATKWCPEYVKGHYRVVRAYKSLGKGAAAKEVEQEIKQYRQMSVLPDYSMALLGVGWIDMVYQQTRYRDARLEETVRRLKVLNIEEPKVEIEIKMTLVPFLVGLEGFIIIGLPLVGSGYYYCTTLPFALTFVLALYLPTFNITSNPVSFIQSLHTGWAVGHVWSPLA